MKTPEELKVYFAEQSKARYLYLRSHKRCVNCATKDERTEKGRTRCEVCAAKNRAYQAKIRKKRGEKK